MAWGRAAADCFAAEGATVAVLAGDAAAIDEAVEQSVELGGEGILANTVHPETVITDQLSDYIAALPAELGVAHDDPVSVMKHITESFDVQADQGRAGLPHELACVTCYLASRSNTLITGANVNVDAGSSFFA
jgi:3-oxoacyl-[acyl-carrier protein] reductase